MEWQRITEQTWLLVENDIGLRQVAKLGPYLGQPEPLYRVTGGGAYSDHPTLDTAKAAAEAEIDDERAL